MRTAAGVDPTFVFGVEDVPEGHPVRSLWQLALDAENPEPVEIEGKSLSDGKHFVDGRRINYPVATLDRFHVYQRVEDGVHSWVIDGNDFPEVAFMGNEPDKPVEPEVEEVQPIEDLMAATVVKQNAWPGERVALVVGGGSALVASGVLYGLSAGAHSNFQSSTTVADMDKYQGQANTFFVSSGVSAAAAAGALTFGALFFVIDGDPRPSLDIRF